MAKKYVSELIGEDYKNWSNESVFLDCATGTGKNEFIIQTLAPYVMEQGKSLLYLCSRKMLQEQMEGRLRDYINVSISTYQHLANQVSRNEPISHYNYIVCDEIHYLFTDSWNNTTNFIYEFLKRTDNSCIIYMSGTAKYLIQYLLKANMLKEHNIISIEPDYSYVDKVTFFRPQNAIPIIKNILDSTNDKILYFTHSYQTFKNIYEYMNSQADYLCSRFAKDLFVKKLRQPDCIHSLGIDHISEEQLIGFDKRLLVTTSVLDVGYTLRDRQLKHIITDFMDVDTIVQCLGRKRSIDQNDTCQFYIYDYSPLSFSKDKTRLSYHHEFKRRYNTIENILTESELWEFTGKFLDVSRPLANEMFPFLYNDYRTNTIKRNEMIIEKCIYDRNVLEQMNMINGFNKYIQLLLPNIGDIAIINIEFECRKQRVKNFLEERKNHLFYRTEIDEIINTFNMKNPVNGRISKSINALNAFIKEANLPYCIVSGVNHNRKSEFYKKTFWKIINTQDEQ